MSPYNDTCSYSLMVNDPLISERYNYLVVKPNDSMITSMSFAMGEHVIVGIGLKQQAIGTK